MFTGVKMRKNGDWYAFYKDIVDGSVCILTFIIGPHETSVAAAKKWDELCYSSEKDVVIFYGIL